MYYTPANVGQPQTDASINTGGEKILAVLAEVHAHDIFSMTEKQFLKMIGKNVKIGIE